MFYCDECADGRNWPKSISKSYGNCEICGRASECNNVRMGALEGKRSNVGVQNDDTLFRAFNSSEVKPIITLKPGGDIIVNLKNAIEASDNIDFDVYIVIGGWDHEGAKVVGVFVDEKIAKEAAEYWEKNGFTIGDKNMHDGYWTEKYDYVEIKKMPVLNKFEAGKWAD